MNSTQRILHYVDNTDREELYLSYPRYLKHRRHQTHHKIHLQDVAITNDQ